MVQLEMVTFSPSPCSRNVCIQYLKLDTVKTMGTHGKINTYSYYSNYIYIHTVTILYYFLLAWQQP